MPQYADARDFSNGIAVVETEIDGASVYDAINTQGELALPLEYGGIVWYSEEEVFALAEKPHGEGQTWKLLDRNGKALSDFEWDEIGSFENNRAAVCKDDKWGVIDSAGQIIIEPKYEDLKLHDDGKQIWVEMDKGDICQIDESENVIKNISSIINSANNYVKSTHSIYIGTFYPVRLLKIWGDRELLPVLVYQKQYGYEYLMANTYAMFDSYVLSLPMLKERYAVSFVDAAGDYAVLSLHPLTNKVSNPVNYDVTYDCVINKEGKTVISPMKDDIILDDRNPGVFRCRHDKNYYLMSEYGTKLTKNYKRIREPRNGYYLYQDNNGLWGYLNQYGSIAIFAQYKNASSFGAGYAPVRTEDGWHIINPLGEIVY